MEAIKDFILAPFRGIREMWDDGPGAQWAAIVLVGLFIAVFWFVGFIIKNELVHGTVNSGVLVDKWFEPSHMQWTGKFYVTVPNRYHVVLEGKNIFGSIRRGDTVVTPDDFEQMKLKEQYSFK